MFSRKIYADWMGDIQKGKIDGILESIEPKGRVLDLGAGAGFLEEYIPDAIATDIDLLNLKKAKAVKVLADGNNLPFKFESFDLLFCIDTVHLLEGDKEIRRVLSNDGKTVVSIFCNEYNIGEKFKTLKRMFRDWRIKEEFFVGKKEMDAVIICGKRYNYNLLVSYGSGPFHRAGSEIRETFLRFGDENPKVEPTLARGIIGVKTSLNPREVVQKIRHLFGKEPLLFQFTMKWVPVDIWTNSDLNSMGEAVYRLRDKILANEKWRMTVEKRRYTKYHKIEVIRELAKLIDREVDLKKPDKILRIDILGKYAGISVLKPRDVFSTMRY